MAALDFHTVPSLHDENHSGSSPGSRFLPIMSPPSLQDFFPDSPPSFSELGPCDAQDPLWVKMSTATATSSKKRKKTDTKPQSQINKCLNEKRRREQENVYIEELAELISASIADMSSLSVKPDKCAILQETVNQIRHIKQQEASAANDAVQQGEVSSSKPTLISSDIFGPLLLEALEGFLFVVNIEGKVEHVTENVSQFIKYTREEVLGKSVYNYIHHGDHARFSSCLLPMSVGWTPIESGSSTTSSGQNNQQIVNKAKNFNCRFLIKPPEDSDQTVEEKQTRTSKYETLQVSSTQLPYDKTDEEGSEVGPCLMCVARRIPPNEKHMGAPIEQFTMKLDKGGKIIGLDTSGLSTIYSQYLNELKSRSIQEFCHPLDSNKLSTHLNEAMKSGQSTSTIYRLKLGSGHDNKYVHVQTKSKMFKASLHEPDFIMATHSIIGDGDFMAIQELSSPASLPGSQSNSGLLSNLNGNNNNNNNINNNNKNMELSFNTVSLNSELGFEFDFPSSTWDLSEDRWGDNNNRPESQSSSATAPSPLYSAPTPATPVSNYPSVSSAFPFSPMSHDSTTTTATITESSLNHQSFLKESPKDGCSNNNLSGVSDDNRSGGGESTNRLRSLLLDKRSSTDSEDGNSNNKNGRNRILKSILDTQDDNVDNQPKNNNNMLLRLLNEKSDDDDVEARAGLKKQNELLQQLLKEEEQKDENQQNEDPLLKSFGFHTGPNSPERSGRKRPSSEDQMGTCDGMGGDGSSQSKRSATSILDSLPQPMQPAANMSNSKLWERNPRLAELLAKQPSTPTTIPPIPASVISATPQDKLPKLVKQPSITSVSSASNWTASNMQQHQQTQQSNIIRGSQTQTVRSPVPRPISSFHGAQQQMHHQSMSISWDAGCSDPVLSDILDSVIDIVPDNIAESPMLMNMINAIENTANMSQNSSNSVGIQSELLQEKIAINAITKSLMQVESAVNKNPFTNNTAITQANQQQQFPPPPMYQQRQRFQIQSPQVQLPRQTHFSITSQQQQQQLLVAATQRQKSIQQQQHVLQQKQRLLQQQQQQQVLMSSNVAANSNDPSNIHNINTLLNDPNAPNVSLRSTSVGESQLSPVGVAGYVNNSQISPGTRQPYSPQPFSPVNGGINSFQSSQQGNQQSRLSPSGLPNFQQAQLSPRVSQGQQGFSNQVAPNTTWSQQQANRLSLQQQQNPMLNAQLTAGSGGYTSTGNRSNTNTTSGGYVSTPSPGSVGGGTTLPSVRSLTSPAGGNGGGTSSPFELSPTSPNTGNYNQPTYTRIQNRTAGCRYPGGGKETPPQLSSPPYHHSHHPPMHPHHTPYHHPQPPPPPPPPHPHSQTHHVPHHMYNNHHSSPQPNPPQPDLVNHHHHQQQQQQQQQQYICYDNSGTPTQTTQLYGTVTTHDRGRNNHPTTGGGNNGMTEFVRQELRAMVGARTGSGSVVSSGNNRNTPQNTGGNTSNMSNTVHVSQADIEALGLTFDIQPHVGESAKLWGTIDMGSNSTQPGSAPLSRNLVDDVSRTNDQKSSLLQKLLSE